MTFKKIMIVLLATVASNFATAGLIDAAKIVVTASSLNTQGWLQVTEVVATQTGTGNDLALSSAGATAIGSSNWGISSPDFAIDGIAPNAFPFGFHSYENDYTSFLEISLFAPAELDSITLFGRTDCCSARDIYNLEVFDVQGVSIFNLDDLDATSASHSVYVDLSNLGVDPLDQLDAQSIPVPSTLVLLGLGLAVLGYQRKKSV